MWDSIRGVGTSVGPNEQRWKKGVTGDFGALLQREVGHVKELEMYCLLALIQK